MPLEFAFAVERSFHQSNRTKAYLLDTCGCLVDGAVNNITSNLHNLSAKGKRGEGG